MRNRKFGWQSALVFFSVWMLGSAWALGQAQIPGQAIQNGAPAAAGQPEAQMGVAPFVLTPEQQKYVDDVLMYWQQSTAKIERFESKFARWQFDPNSTNDANAFTTVASGVVRYMAPDKGMFQIEEMRYRKQRPDGEWNYEAIDGQFGEWWICDGESVHIYDRTQKKVTKHPLPPTMRGAEVFNSPLPFVFGVNAQKMKERYWLRPLPGPPGPDGKPNPQLIVIEAYPKNAADAVNYHHVTVYLDRQQFLPQILEIALTQWTEEAKVRDMFEFKDRQVNSNFMDKLKETFFRQAFIPTEPPKDWTVEVSPLQPEQPVQDGLRAANPNAPAPNAIQR